MSIDWITVGAQIVNFLVLVWLLQRFLYRPILDGIDAREAEIANRMAEAAKMVERAESEAEVYHGQLEKLRATETELTDAIRQTALKERDELLAQAHQQLQQERKDFDVHLAAEKRKYIEHLDHAAAGVVLQLTRKAMADLSDQTLEARIASHFVNRLTPMAPRLQKMAREDRGVVVTSREPLPDEVRERLQTDLQALLPGSVCTFDTDSSLSFGVVLRVGSAHVDWTVDSYLENLGEMLEGQMISDQDLKVHSG